MNTLIPIQLFNTRAKKQNFNQYQFNYKNQCHINKPELAFWTAPLKELNNFPVSTWINWCIENDFRIHNYSFILYPKVNVKIFEIKSISDVYKLPLFFKDGSYCINFSTLSNQYDGLYLTEQGINNLRRVNLLNGALSFDAWDIASICWFNSQWIDSYQLISNYKRKLFKILKD